MAKQQGTGGGGAGSKPSVPKTPPNVIRERLRSAIRKVWSLYSSERRQVLWAARRTKKRINKDGSTSKVPAVFYLCAECKGEFKASDVQVDHVEPVGRTPPFPPADASDPSWSAWLLKLFCETDNLRVLCKPCHKLKSKEERKSIVGRGK